MNYRILAPSTFPAGSVLTLTDAQAHDRLYALRPRGAGVYEVVIPVNFKAGEVIGYASELPKSWADKLEDAALSEVPASPARRPAVRRIPKTKP